MQYIIDTANIKDIERAFEIFPMSGVTTNPTIVAEENRNFFDLMRDIRAVIGQDKMLHVEVISNDADGIVADAMVLRDKIGGNIVIKVPVTLQGYKSMKELKRRGFQVTATAIYTPAQALLAANCGADYTAPYVNRIDNISGMGVSVVRMITELFTLHKLPTKVLAASFKNVQQIHEVSLAGCQAVTVAPDLMWKIAEHPLTDMSVNIFLDDWGKIYGEGLTVVDVDKNGGKTLSE